MWIISKLGFYSIVRDRDDAGSYWVRARVRADLERLTSILPGEIIFMPDADYRFRVKLSREEKNRAVALLSDSIDYPNFKNEIARDATQRDRLTAYHEVWHTLQGLAGKGH